VQPDIDILGISLKTFGIFFALNFVAWGALLARRLREIGRPVDWSYEIVFAALIGGLIGARGYYLIQHHDTVTFGDVFSGSGLVWYGGLLGGTIAVLIWAWRREFLSLALLDMSAVGLALGYAIGRIGCQISGDGDYGKPSDLPWAMGYPDGTVPTDPGVTVHPTPIYETLAMGVVALVLWHMRDHVRPGVLFAGYLVLAGLERFLVEFLRRNDEVALGLTAPQFESLALFVAGAVWLALIARRHGGLLDESQQLRHGGPRAGAGAVQATASGRS
jgi:phosphatidylglycerol---prolipoprotein diacylglyceryl transferase